MVAAGPPNVSYFTKFMTTNWHEHSTTVHNSLRNKIVTVDKGSFWLCVIHKSATEASENGMINYDHKSDKIISITEYPSHIDPYNHCCVGYKKNIYIVEGELGQIFSFSRKSIIPKIGKHPNSIAVYNKIHIFNGRENDSHHLIYDPETNELIDHKVNKHKIKAAQTLLYQSRIIRMGGFDKTTRQFLDIFEMSPKIQKIQVNNVPNFKIIQQWKLPLAISAFGSILFQNHILIFGGITTGNKFVDSIYSLDLSNERKIEAHQMPNSRWLYCSTDK